MATTCRTVLYVEDNDDDRYFMRHAFKNAGLECSLQIAVDGREAIKYLSGDGKYADRGLHPGPQLVLLDLNLPHVSGFEVLVWIRKQPGYASLPVVILSSSRLECDRAAANLLGSSDYCVKPVSGSKYNELVIQLREKWFAGSAAGSPADDNHGHS